MAEANLTVHRLRELLSYDPETGHLKWLKRTSHRINIGDVAGAPIGNGYIMLGADKNRIYAHRAAWALHTGSWPNGHIDHINGDRQDNRISNLRDVTRSVNIHNQHRKKISSTGKRNVLARSGKFVARCQIDGKYYWIGTYPTPEKAASVVARFRQLVGLRAGDDYRSPDLLGGLVPNHQVQQTVKV